MWTATENTALTGHRKIKGIRSREEVGTFMGFMQLTKCPPLFPYTHREKEGKMD